MVYRRYRIYNKELDWIIANEIATSDMNLGRNGMTTHTYSTIIKHPVYDKWAFYITEMLSENTIKNLPSGEEITELTEDWFINTK